MCCCAMQQNVRAKAGLTNFTIESHVGRALDVRRTNPDATRYHRQRLPRRAARRIRFFTSCPRAHEQPRGSAALPQRRVSLQTVEELLIGLVERRDRLDELIDVLQQQESSRLALSAMSLEEQAAQCLEEGCPIDTVETLVNELETAARTLSGQGKSHRYVDELISLLSTSQGMPVSKPPLSSLSAPFVVSPAKVLS